MTKTSLAAKMILFGCALSVLPTIAVAQASAAIERQWMSLSNEIQTCLQAKLVLSNSSINEKMQQGLSLNDPLISKQISDCKNSFDLSEWHRFMEIEAMSEMSDWICRLPARNRENMHTDISYER